MTAASLEPLLFDPYDYRFHDDPYPVYRRLRHEAPVYHNADLGFWALSSHRDVAAALRDSKRLSSANGVSLDSSAYGPHAHRVMSFLAMDDPRHLRMRRLVSKGFTPRRVDELREQIRKLTLHYLEPALDTGSFDWVADVAGKLPMDVVSELLGVPESDRDELRRMADLLVHREEGVQDVPVAAMEAAVQLFGYYNQLLTERRRNPGTDLISALLGADIDGDRLDDSEIVGFLFLMVVAGNETTTKLLGNALYWADRHRDQYRRVVANLDCVPDWVEETLRYDTSTQILARTAATDIEYAGTTIPAGEKVLLLIGSANRDDSVFDAADEFQIGHDSRSKLLSFGAGTHFCLGAHLARLEANIALREFAARVADYSVDAKCAVRVHSTNVRGFSALPITVVSS
ncbi:cytochrome P450 [Skermania sp. ID1734]|uniref:cytochrome P450 n=1 Tax=Skermania sp. ID1734 TaxID=2597516 RepID=UPI00117D7EB9|nr:cytochrome P450 [Skermania sp. ID1734]TSD95665.1 cytochrome P450 [Skermania sp. ID1734]